PASARWLISTWEVSYEPPTPDRTIHCLSAVAGIAIYHGCFRSPRLRSCLRQASQYCRCSPPACGRLLGQIAASDRNVVQQVGPLAVLLPVCCESWLHHHGPSS